MAHDQSNVPIRGRKREILVFASRFNGRDRGPEGGGIRGRRVVTSSHDPTGMTRRPEAKWEARGML